MLKRGILLSSFIAMFSGCYALNFTENLVETYCDRVTACEADMIAFYQAAGYDEATAKATYDGTKEAYCTVPEDTECDKFDKSVAKECMADAEAQSCEDFAQGLTPETCEHAAICGS